MAQKFLNCFKGASNVYIFNTKSYFLFDLTYLNYAMMMTKDIQFILPIYNYTKRNRLQKEKQCETRIIYISWSLHIKQILNDAFCKYYRMDYSKEAYQLCKIWNVFTNIESLPLTFSIKCFIFIQAFIMSWQYSIASRIHCILKRQGKYDILIFQSTHYNCF